MRFLPLLFLTLLTLAACSSEPVIKTYSYTPPQNPGGMMCVVQCGQARNYCNQSCDLDNRECVKEVQTQGMKDYAEYTRTQFHNGQPIEFRPSDFERTNRCDNEKKDCTDRCENHYASCYKECGGQVETNASCRFLCF